MIKFFIYSLLFIFMLHFTLYYCNLDLMDLFNKHKESKEVVYMNEISIDDKKNEDVEIKELILTKNDLENSLNELKQMNSNILNEYTE